MVSLTKKKFYNSLLSTMLLLLLTFGSSHAADTAELQKFIDAYEPQDQQAISNIIDMYRKAPLIQTPLSAERQSYGKMSAPVSLLEWIDIQCPHCKNLNQALEQLQAMSTPDSWRIESRHYPLDNECNPNGPESRKPGVSCLAAKVLICLADKPNGHDVRNELFAQQRFLTKEIIWNTAADDANALKELKACVESDTTAKRLKEDIELAEAHHIRGTPLVVINGKQSASAPPIIYSLILAEGNPNAEPFLKLPAPQEMKDEPGHEGHNH